MPEGLILPLYIWGGGRDTPHCAVFRSVWLVVRGHLTALLIHASLARDVGLLPSCSTAVLQSPRSSTPFTPLSVTGKSLSFHALVEL